ncbi:hypothetical protein ACTL32_18445 [Planococcus sp. FY231025]|uniref:hypothetical protein n=1 Tax=Planococcus sp. FY231025 TaxID=3455699 RepID=UPI003F8E96C9
MLIQLCMAGLKLLAQDPKRKAASKLAEGSSANLFATKQRSDAGAPVLPARARGKRPPEVEDP